MLLIDYENRLGKRLFHSLINYESKVWLDGFKYLNDIGPKINSGFLQYFEICQFVKGLKSYSVNCSLISSFDKAYYFIMVNVHQSLMT